jgi:hypothetical protein
MLNPPPSFASSGYSPGSVWELQQQKGEEENGSVRFGVIGGICWVVRGDFWRGRSGGYARRSGVEVVKDQRALLRSSVDYDYESLLTFRCVL